MNADVACRWPWLFVFAYKQLTAVVGSVAIETTTPDLVCAEQLIAPKVTAVGIAASCPRGIKMKTDDDSAASPFYRDPLL